MRKDLFILIFTLLLIYSCSKDDGPTPLPESIRITILNYDIDDQSVILKGTELSNGLTGLWTLESNTNGSFLDSTSWLTTLNASLFENHLIRWSISNGSEIVYKETNINISNNFSLIQLINEGVEIDSLLIEYTIQELINAGVTIEELLYAGVTVQNLIDAEISISELRLAGITINQLLNVGISLQELVNAGITIEEFLYAGVTVQNLIDVGISISELLLAGITINEFLDIGISIQELINAGVTINQLIDVGVTTQELIDAGLPLIDIVSSGISSLQLIELGVSEDDLISSNIINQIPGTTLYLLNYFYEKFDHNSAITFCDNLIIGDLNNWYLPTIYDLRTIYNIRDQVLLEYTNENYWSSTFSHYGLDGSANYHTKNMNTGNESSYYGFEKRIIPVTHL